VYTVLRMWVVHHSDLLTDSQDCLVEVHAYCSPPLLVTWCAAVCCIVNATSGKKTMSSSMGTERPMRSSQPLQTSIKAKNVTWAVALQKHPCTEQFSQSQARGW
jgi:hypothetical protein